ncbi:hypothetical protein Tco_1102837 [Tanacetum coccineum]
MSSASSAVTYTSVYTDSEPGRAFWGADDEEISEGGIPRVIILGYDRLLIQPVAPPSPDYIPGPEDPHTPLVPQDEDEREPMTANTSCLIRPPAESTRYVMEFGSREDQGVQDDEKEDGPGERLARCMAPPAPSSPLLPSSGCPTQIQTLRIASNQALIDAVTTALPSPPLPPSLYILPPVDCRDDIHESEQLPQEVVFVHSRLRLYKGWREYLLAETFQRSGIRLWFVQQVDAEEGDQGIRDVGVTELAELHEHDTQDLYALLEDAQDSRVSNGWWRRSLCVPRARASHSIRLSQATHQELQTHRDHVYAHETHLQAHQTQQQLQETLRVIRDMRREMSDMQAELLSLREQQRRARQPGPEARIPDHQDAFGDADIHI